MGLVRIALLTVALTVFLTGGAAWVWSIQTGASVGVQVFAVGVSGTAGLFALCVVLVGLSESRRTGAAL